MNRLEIEQTITERLDLIRGVVRKTLKKYRANLCESDIEDIDSSTVLCLLDGRMDSYVHVSESGLKQWIGYIAMQRTIDYLRALKKTSGLAEDSEREHGVQPVKGAVILACPEPSAVDGLVHTEFQLLRRAQLRAAVASLSDDEQDAYSEMIKDGYCATSYARSRGIKPSTAHTRRHRMIKNLRKVI